MANLDPIKITKGYEKIKVFNIGTSVVREAGLIEGDVLVFVAGDAGVPPPAYEGRLQANGIISRMSKLYSDFRLHEGDEIRFTIVGAAPTNAIQLWPSQTILERRTAPKPVSPPPVQAGAQPERVFARRGLRHIHIEAFSPQNLHRWEPATETDVYMAFGVLAEYTDFRYCCGASIDLLRRLGYAVTEQAKPDAILIDARTDEYVVAEWKILSSDFKKNHLKEDVDVLVVWRDDEADREKLPTVLELKGIARTAAAELFQDEE